MIMYNNGYDCGPGIWSDRQMQLSPVNITDAGDAYIINLYAPRLNKEQFSITTQQDILSVKYNESGQGDKGHYTRKEYRPGEIDRSFDLKGKVEIDAINASYADGVLSIHLPKTDAARKKAQKVDIR
jgi:HSP20 family protein